MDDYRSSYPFWEMLTIWIFLAAVGLGISFFKALPAIIASLILAAPVLTICAVILMMTGTAMYLAIKNNDARFWFLPIFPVVLLINGSHNLVNWLRGGEAINYFLPCDQKRLKE
jgi:hypothetical protein